MAPTSNERREVAEHLRRLHLAGANKALIELTLSDVIGAWHKNGISWDYIMERLADLIDPTCMVSSVETYDDELGQLEGWEFHLTCGHSIQRPYYKAPSYCPDCGARVVSDDERGYKDSHR